jgi:hypothetical protein
LQVFPLRRFFTVTLVPNGKVLLAAVILFGSKVSPDAVFRPWNPGPYQEATVVNSPSIGGRAAKGSNRQALLKTLLHLLNRFE